MQHSEQPYAGLKQVDSSVSVISNPAYLGGSPSKEDLLRPLDYSKSVKTNQYVGGLAATMAATAVGCILAYTSPVLAQLPYTDSEGGWIAALLHLGACVGGIVGGPMNVLLGKRLTLVAIMIPFLAGTGLLIIGGSVYMFYIGRFLCGIASGTICVTAPTYIAEISEPSIRGTLGSGFQLLLVLGVLFTNVIGIWAQWRVIGIFCAVFPAITIVAMLFIAKDTPADCVIKAQKAEDAGNKALASAKMAQAMDSLRWLRGSQHDVDRELREIEESIMKARASTFTMADVKTPGFYKPLIVCLGLMVFQQMGGINAVISYTNAIFAAAGSSLSPDAASVIVMGTQVASTFGSTFVVDRAGRKPLLYASCILEVVSLVMLGVFFYVKDGKGDIELADKLGALPVVSLILYMFAFSIGYGPLPWVLMGELFGDDTRAAASSVATALNWFMAFLVTKTYQDMQTGLESYGTFWFYAAVTSLSVPFLFFLTPETKGKSIEDIQKLFQRS